MCLPLGSLVKISRNFSNIFFNFSSPGFFLHKFDIEDATDYGRHVFLLFVLFFNFGKVCRFCVFSFTSTGKCFDLENSAFRTIFFVLKPIFPLCFLSFSIFCPISSMSLESNQCFRKIMNHMFFLDFPGGDNFVFQISFPQNYAHSTKAGNMVSPPPPPV